MPILNMDRFTYSHHSPKELWYNNLVFTLGFYNLKIGIEFVEVLCHLMLGTWIHGGFWQYWNHIMRDNYNTLSECYKQLT